MIDIDDRYGWLIYADNSYISTRLLFFTGFTIESPVGAHRTIELYLKTYLVSQGIKIKKGSLGWGHKLSKLCDDAIKIDNSFDNEDLKRRIKYFEKYFNYVRYPSGNLAYDDGCLLWFGFDINILVFDEIIAFIRPRIQLEKEDWESTPISKLLSNQEKVQKHQLRALKDHNKYLNIINNCITYQSNISFEEEFTFDEPGC